MHFLEIMETEIHKLIKAINALCSMAKERSRKVCGIC
jgi:hypothetical protein